MTSLIDAIGEAVKTALYNENGVGYTEYLFYGITVHRENHNTVTVQVLKYEKLTNLLVGDDNQNHELIYDNVFCHLDELENSIKLMMVVYEFVIRNLNNMGKN